MQAPQPTCLDSWTRLSSDPYEALTKDFVHDKLLNFEISIHPSKGSTIINNYIRPLQHNKFESVNGIKVWFPIWKQGTIYFRSLDNQVKLHYDNGVTSYGRRLINWYGSAQSRNNLESSVFKIGAIYTDPDFSMNNRIRFAIQQGKSTVISTAHKVSFTRNEWQFSAYEIWNWNGLASVTSNAMKICYQHNHQNSLALQARNEGRREFKNFRWANLHSYFTNFTANFTHQIKANTILGAEVLLSIAFTPDNIKQINIAILKLFPNRDCWMKLICSHRSIALAYKRVIQGYGSWIFGAEVSNLGRDNSFRYGIQIDLHL